MIKDYSRLDIIKGILFNNLYNIDKDRIIRGVNCYNKKIYELEIKEDMEILIKMFDNQIQSLIENNCAKFLYFLAMLDILLLPKYREINGR